MTQDDRDLGRGLAHTYYGKYRGKVVDNNDPDNLGQLQVAVPDVLGDVNLWAMPSVPYAGPQVGWFMLPPIAANVWVEFEGGNPQYPIWTGCYWSKEQCPGPTEEPKDQTKLLKTPSFSLAIKDAAGESSLQIQLSLGDDPSQTLQIQFSSDGVKIANGQQTSVTLTSDTVTVSNGESSTVTVGADSITVTNGASSVSISTSAINLDHSSGAAQVAVSDSGVNVANGASSVAVSAASVSINDGALMIV